VTVLPAKKLKIFSCGSEEEFGHIPSWLLERLTATTGFSPYLTKCFAKFSARYSKLTGHRNPPECEPESDVINSLLRDIRNGDKDLYLPLDTFNSLKAWEWSGAHAEARDHYFHTLNNLLLGYVLLGETLRDITAEGPDEFVVDPTGKSKLKSWEALWFLTCLNHDPGYKGEKFWPAVYANFGLRRTKVPPKPIPAEIATDLVDAWDTDLREARTELLDLYNRVVKLWSPPRFAAKMRAPFDAALRLAYFDGVRSSHRSSASSSVARNRSANSKKRRFSASFVSSPVAIRLSSTGWRCASPARRSCGPCCPLRPITSRYGALLSSLRILPSLHATPE
jgi:hypothetical protein